MGDLRWALLDGALTSGLDEVVPLLVGLAWPAGLTAVAALVFRRDGHPAAG